MQPSTLPSPAPRDRIATMVYRGLLGFDGLLALVVVAFLVAEIVDGRATAESLAAWTILIGGLALIITAAVALRDVAQRGLSITLLLLPAMPGLLIFLFFALILILNPRWN